MPADASTQGRHALADLRSRTQGRTVAASTSDAVLAGVLTTAGLVAAWLVTYLAGGSKSALPHAFYIPVILAAIRFGPFCAFIVAVTAGLAVGPFMPLDVATQSAQVPGNWVTRLVTFVLIGQLTAHLSRHSLPSLTDQISARRFQGDIHQAITEGQFRLEYQPVVSLDTGELVAVETLIRWDHPTRGLVPPDEFIGEAERLGGIEDITRWVIATACRQVADWREGPLAGVKYFGIAVNVSALDLSDDALAGFVSDTLEQTGVPGCWLHLEITETALVKDIDAAVNRLMNLRLLGIRLAIDDFGTGESSLAHLHRFPVDALKLDRTFLDRLEDEERGSLVAAGIVELAHRLQLTTVAEGVETAEQARLVRSFGCSHAQGYLFSRPLRPTQLKTLLADNQDFRAANVQAMSRPAIQLDEPQRSPRRRD